MADETANPGKDYTAEDIVMKLREIERTMDRVGGWVNIHERWSSGRYLIDLRNPETHYLPKGQLTAIATAIGTSTRELSDRMRIAEAFRTFNELKKAATACNNVWSCLLKRLPATREARTGPTKRPKDLRRKIYELLGQLLAYRKDIGREERLHATKLYDIYSARDEGEE